VEDPTTGKLAKPVLLAFGAVTAGGPVEGITAEWAQVLKSARGYMLPSGFFDQQVLLATLLEVPFIHRVPALV